MNADRVERIRKYKHEWYLKNRGPLKPRPSPEERFWKKVQKQTEDSCWLWTGGRTGSGQNYGHFYPGKQGTSAHIFCYQLHYGDIPKGMVVRHSCDNGLCVNPKHLLLGTQKQNIQDCLDRGRRKPEKYIRPHSCKLSTQDVIEIRILHQQGVRPSKIAKTYNVQRTQIYRILNGTRWGWL